MINLENISKFLDVGSEIRVSLPFVLVSRNCVNYISPRSPIGDASDICNNAIRVSNNTL
jgi:hypothetical protein